MFKYYDGQEVEYDNGVMKGKGIIVGYCNVEQAVIGATAIIKDLSGNVPNKSYQYQCFACAEIHINRNERKA
jgi:hypothetical protein